MDSRDITLKVESFLQFHPNASLSHAADRLGLSPQDIEQALQASNGMQFQEFQQNLKLNEAFRQLGETRLMPMGSWEETRYHPRRIIPKTTVRYKVRSFWTPVRNFSIPYPLVDLSCGGLALLSDVLPALRKHVSLLLKFPDRSDELRLQGRIVYAVATGIAGFRYRVGIQFLPFADRRGCNHPEILETLEDAQKQGL
jgi:AraC-like DNA-binding protein